MVIKNLPDGWSQVDSGESHQIEEAYQRVSDGLVISVERGTTNESEYSATFLPENFKDDNQPLRSYGDDRYLEVDDAKEKVEEAAREWMKENST